MHTHGFTIILLWYTVDNLLVTITEGLVVKEKGKVAASLCQSMGPREVFLGFSEGKIHCQAKFCFRPRELLQ